MIEFSHVYKTYAGNIHALKNVKFTIDKSEFVFLTGPSGAGKTTLLLMISAFDMPTSGQVQIMGQNILGLSATEVAHFRRKIGVVFQDYKLLKDKTVFQNIALPLIVRGDRAPQIQRRVEEVLNQVGLKHKADQFPEFLSGGEQQRTAIARAIVHHPGILIADEPTGNLDPQLGEEIMDLLEKVASQGTTVFVATHDHELVRRRKKRTISLLNGEIAGDGYLPPKGEA